MSLCSCDFNDDSDWHWDKLGEPKPFDLARRKRCESCKELINKGEECQDLNRWRVDEDGEEIKLASMYLCETCNDLTLAIDELNGCYTIGGESIKSQIVMANDDL